mmetsp:Transcript_15048/g.46733  ORF Transcript_15048/g.46733 Transcript_15048/m.46733 type:complete len:298 (-) Transcript_15048:207-1100(-)
MLVAAAAVPRLVRGPVRGPFRRDDDPFSIVFAASNCWRRPLEVQSNDKDQTHAIPAPPPRRRFSWRGRPRAAQAPSPVPPRAAGASAAPAAWAAAPRARAPPPPRRRGRSSPCRRRPRPRTAPPAPAPAPRLSPARPGPPRVRPTSSRPSWRCASRPRPSPRRRASPTRRRRRAAARRSRPTRRSRRRRRRCRSRSRPRGSRSWPSWPRGPPWARRSFGARGGGPSSRGAGGCGCAVVAAPPRGATWIFRGRETPRLRRRQGFAQRQTAAQPRRGLAEGTDLDCTRAERCTTTSGRA